MFTPGASKVRHSVEEHSALPLSFIYQMPRWGLPLLLAALLISGLALGGWVGAVLLLAIVVFISWLAFLSWPSLTWQARVPRVAIAVILLMIAIGQVVE